MKTDHRPETYQMLDAWRALACLAVVFYHICHELKGGPMIWAERGYLGVQVFFVVSGYCIASAALGAWRREATAGAFTLARLRRIFPPLWWSLLFYALVKLAVSLLGSRGVLKEDAELHVDLLHQGPIFFLANATLTEEIFHTRYLSRINWSLCYELAFYLLVAGILLITRRTSRREGVLLDVLHSLTAVALGWLIFRPEWRIYPFDLWPLFGAGVLAFDLLHRRSARWWLLLIAAEWLAFLWCRDFPIGPVRTMCRLDFIAAALVATAIVLLRPLDARFATLPGARWLFALGRFSYSVYLIHYLFISICMKVFPRLPLLGRSALAVGLLTAAVAVSGGYLFYWFFERPALQRKRHSFVAPASVTAAPPIPL